MEVGMDHNVDGLSPDAGSELYLSGDLANNDRPYKIVTDETYGRHMVAERTIKPGEIIMVDKPVTMGPACSSGIAPVCLSCYRRLPKPSYLCSKCGWPLCGIDCENDATHRNQECLLFSENNIKANASEFNYNDEEPMYSVISPLRALLLEDRDGPRWSRIWSLMSHNKSRRSKDYWKLRNKTTVDLIRNKLGLEQFSEDKIDTVLGIFLVNDFEVNNDLKSEEFSSSQKTCLRGLYSIASIPNHSCVSNTNHSFGGRKEDYKMFVRASRLIEAGEDITHTYVDPLEPLLVRQELLNLGKFFHCSCTRCSDPTELGTFSSAMKCPKCRKGNLLTTDVSTTDADWKCDSCSNLLKSDKISRVTAAVKAHAEKIEYKPELSEETGIPAHEAFIKKYGQVLHPQHVVLVYVKYCLAKLYGRLEGYEADRLSDQQLARKEELCEQVLSVFNKILPGQNRMRGVIMYELHLPLVMVANRQLQKGPGGGADPKEIKSKLKRGVEMLKQSLAILKLEPEGSFESKIVQGSKDSVKELEEFYATISKIL